MFLKTIKKILNIAFLFLVISFFTSTIHADPNTGTGTGSTTSAAESTCGNSTYLENPANLIKCKELCKDSNSSIYSSTACTEIILGLHEVDTSSFLIAQNPTQFIVIVFQFFLAIVLIIVVYRILMAGIGIVNSGADKDKQVDSFKKIANAIIGLLVTFSSLGITNYVKYFFGKNTNEQLLRECADLIVEDADPEVVERCNLLTDDPT